ncbi:hypothetical protein [Wukongibacter sp. M2B1]|uniref:hypothetical protein n=1 Tax=Wukongibacter sp. M2B1 TaxID=3088895 RepID=UPI003D79DA75
MISISSNGAKQALHKYLLQYRTIFKKQSFDSFISSPESAKIYSKFLTKIK